jgi:uncharacterized membrane protein
MNKLKFLTIGLLSISPVFAFAQSGSAGNDIWSLWEYVFVIIGRLTQIFWFLSIVTFLWGLVEFLRKSDSKDEQKKAKSMMIGSIIAFGIAVSFWALITFVISSADLSVDQGSIPIVTSE